MKRRFVVMLDNATNAQNAAFLDYLKQIDVGWWHYLNNSWLLYDLKNQLTTEIIRDKVMEIYPNITNLVIEITSTIEPWHGFGPSNEKRNMFTWLRENWKAD